MAACGGGARTLEGSCTETNGERCPDSVKTISCPAGECILHAGSVQRITAVLAATVNELRIYQPLFDANEVPIPASDITVRIDGVEAALLDGATPRTHRFAVARASSKVATIEIVLAGSDPARHVVNVLAIDSTVRCTLCGL